MTVRGQYRAGAVRWQGGARLSGGAGRARSDTETFVVVKAEVRELALGRRAVLPAHRQAAGDARVRDRHPVPQRAALDLPRPASRHLVPNRLVLRLQPDEGMKLYLMSKDPGPGGMRFKNAPLESELRREPSRSAIATPTSAC